MGLQIIFRKAVFPEKRTTFLCQTGYRFFQVFYSAALSAEKRTCLLGAERSNLTVNLCQPGSFCKGAGASLFQIVHNLGLSPVVFSHNNIILKVL